MSERWEKVRGGFGRYLLLAILPLLPFLAGKYFEFNTPGAFDSGCYVYSAKHVLDGARIGVEEKPSAQVGTLLVNMLGVWMFGFDEIGAEILQTVLQLGALVLMFLAARKVYGHFAATVVVTTASFYLSAPMIAKFGNVKEQFMIAFMVMGMSCFILRQMSGRAFWAVLAGAFLSWGPLFKQTGVSALIAVCLFLFFELIFRGRDARDVLADIGLIAVGSAAGLLPVYGWLISCGAEKGYMPYYCFWKIVCGVFSSHGGEQAAAYVSNSRKLVSLSRQSAVVFRYYKILALPISMALGSLMTAGIQTVTMSRRKRRSVKDGRLKYVFLFGLWWVLDMVFVWISPRSYEQYYLPLTASGAMAGGYLVDVYLRRLRTTNYKINLRMIGTAGIIAMVAMGWPIFFGVSDSPHNGKGYGQRQRGYTQKFKEVDARRSGGLKGDWELAADYIRVHTKDDDTIYVWGWVPGIYMKAQRLSSVSKAFTSEMHVVTAEQLGQMVDEILAGFGRQRPKFIVDTNKIHFPWNRPPLQLWPRTNKGFVPCDEKMITGYDRGYYQMLCERIGVDEGQRYLAMEPLRDFVMSYYEVRVVFGNFVLFELKDR